MRHRAPYFVQELLKQPAQVQRRTTGAVAHDRGDGVARAVDIPTDNRRGVFSRRASNARRPPIAVRSSFAGNAALSRRSEQLPSGTRTCAGFVMQREKRSAIEHDDVVSRVFGVFLECPAMA